MYYANSWNVYLKGNNNIFYISKKHVINSYTKKKDFSSFPFHNERNKTVFSLRIFNVRHYLQHMCTAYVRRNTLANNNGSFNFPWDLGLSLQHLLHL